MFAVLSGLMLVGACVPSLVDMVQNGRLRWSLYAVGALGMAWLILAPWFLLSRSRAGASWAAGAVAVPSYLLLIESLGSAKGWFPRLGLPAALLGLAGWGSIAWLWSRRGVDRWYATAGTILVLGLVGLAECALARPHLIHDPYFPVRRAAILSIIGTSLVVGVGRLAVKHTRSTAGLQKD
jgi:hypothetical protein